MEGWVTVAEGSSLEDLHPTAAGAGKQIKHGAPFDITIKTPFWFPVAPLFDSLGSEYVAQLFHTETGGILRDVEGRGWYEIVLHMEANAFAITPGILAGVAAILIGLGIAVTAVRIDSPGDALEDIKKGLGSLADIVKWGAIGAAAVGGLMVMSSLRKA